MCSGTQSHRTAVGIQWVCISDLGRCTETCGPTRRSDGASAELLVKSQTHNWYLNHVPWMNNLLRNWGPVHMHLPEG